MKFGMRKPNLKKSIKARTTGRIKRAAKKAINPVYGKKGMGIVNNPKKAVYNKVYNKTTVGLSDLSNKTTKANQKQSNRTNNYNQCGVGIDESKIISREQAYQEKVEPILKMMHGCAQGLEKAESPYWFFYIYRNAEKYCKELLEYEDKMEWKNGTPTEAFNELKEKKQDAIRMMIERYYNILVKKSKALNLFKINYKEKFLIELNKYISEYNEENKLYIEKLYNEFGK